MEKNILDRAMDKLSVTLMRQDERAKNSKSYPFGQVPATKAEKNEQFKNLDISQLTDMIQKYGQPAVNEYLRKHMGGEYQ